MLKIIFLLFFISSCTFFKSGSLTQKAVLYEKIGVAFLQQNNYPSALSRLLKAEQFDKENASIQNYLGLSYFALKKYKRSIVHFKKAIILSPQQTEYKNNLAYSFIQSKKYKIAFKILKKNLKDLTYPLQHKTYFYLSLLKTKIKKNSSAKKFVAQSLALNSSFCPSNLQLAQILHKNKKYYASNQQLTKTFSICPHYKTSQNLFTQAINHYNLKEYIKAFAIFKVLSKKNTILTSKIKAFLNPNKKASTH